VHVLDNGFTSGSGGITTGVPGSIGSAATPASLALSYLNDFQVNLMVQAVEASSDNTLVQAPRVSVTDGQTAVLSVGTNFQYVSNLTPTVGAGGSVGFTATVNTGQSGISLQVTPTVSADRKYVNLTLTPTLSLPPVITPFNLTTPASNTTTTSGTGTVFTSGSSNAVAETIELVTQNTTAVETQVNVPDGGTLLLGGQTIAGEAFREQGVPVLSKIPFLKRLFTNTASAKDEQVLLILVKPTIMIQHEQEDKFFPLLSNRPTGN
jgi:type II secretory pathway component GspD/PulD (secretin)